MPKRKKQDASVAALDRRVGTSAEDASAQDWVVAEALKPDLAGETADGLTDLEEEVRRAAEDLPADELWEERVRRKAHELWLSEGGQHGRADDHWRIAAELVAAEIARDRADLPYSGDSDKQIEEQAIQANLGEFPELSDQGKDETRR